MMRGLFVWAIVIFSAAVAYVVAGILLFQPERPPPIAFEAVESVLERSREAYKAQTPPEEQAVTLSPADEARKAKIVANVQRTVAQYESAAVAMPPPAVPVMQIMTEYTRTGLLPPVYPMSDGTSAPYIFSSTPQINLIDTGGNDMGCEGVGTAEAVANLMIGNDQDNRLSCTKPGKATVPRILLGGPGNDTLRNLSGPTLFAPGTGNDVIEGGDGTTMVLLDDAWGQDALKIDCATAATPVAADQALSFPFRNFIIFSPHIARNDVVWDEGGTTLRHLRTGDSLKIGGKCVNLVFYDQIPAQTEATDNAPPP